MQRAKGDVVSDCMWLSALSIHCQPQVAKNHGFLVRLGEIWDQSAFLNTDSKEMYINRWQELCRLCWRINEICKIGIIYNFLSKGSGWITELLNCSETRILLSQKKKKIKFFPKMQGLFQGPDECQEESPCHLDMGNQLFILLGQTVSKLWVVLKDIDRKLREVNEIVIQSNHKLLHLVFLCIFNIYYSSLSDVCE